MFNVSRYDPNKSAKQDKKRSGGSSSSRRGKKRRRRGHHEHGSQTVAEETEGSTNDGKSHGSLRVIAPDATKTEPIAGLQKKLPQNLAEEAFDDLDLLEEIIDGKQSPAVGTAAEEEMNVSQLDDKEVETALRISKLPIKEAADGWRLAPFLVDNLKRDGFEHFFPIQALAIPDVISSERHAHIQAQDVCITAPTGSGKTLSYALPIINSLAGRQVLRLRALIVLPSRDLAVQVHRVLENYVQGSDLKVGLAIGKSDFKEEQKALTVDTESNDPDMLRHRLSFEPGNLQLALRLGRIAAGLASTTPTSNKSWSTVDILVCTPGRLVDHLDKTAGFNLQHLHFLIVDEADRLMSQSYHNWIDRVVQSANSASMTMWKRIVENNNRLPDWPLSANKRSFEIEPITWRQGGVDGDVSAFNTNDSFFAPAAAVCKPVQLRKFLVSATMTRDPQKLAALRLVNPKHFDMHRLTKHTAGGKDNHKYAMPDGLREHTVECTAEQKPLVLLALLLEQLEETVSTRDQAGNKKKQKKMIVVFTASLDSTHRLARLLQLLWMSGGYTHGSTRAAGSDSTATADQPRGSSTSSVVEFSSALSQKERSSLVKRCNDPNGDVSVVVCSDSMSRGMDLDYATSVINYDVPRLAKTYVHRCGRTARAGKQGVATTLLKGGQVGQFQKMRQLIRASDKVTGTRVKKSLVRNVVPMYRQCVAALRDVLDAEENGELGHSEELSADYVPDSSGV